MALSLRHRYGHQRAFALTGGFDAWKRAGLPTEPLQRHAGLHAPAP